MKTSDILNKAAEITMERGHGKCRYVADDGRVCILGACALAAEMELTPFIPTGSIPGWSELSFVLRASVHLWNDRDETTEAMAIGALHEAAILAKEQGD